MTTERTADTESSYADRVLHEVQISAACGLDPDRAREVAGSPLAGLAKMAKALEDATYAPREYEKIARSAAHAMKSADGLVRLMEFCIEPAGLAGGRGNRLAEGAHERAARDRLGLDRGGRRGGRSAGSRVAGSERIMTARARGALVRALAAINTRWRRRH